METVKLNSFITKVKENIKKSLKSHNDEINAIERKKNEMYDYGAELTNRFLNFLENGNYEINSKYNSSFEPDQTDKNIYITVSELEYSKFKCEDFIGVSCCFNTNENGYVDPDFIRVCSNAYKVQLNIDSADEAQRYIADFESGVSETLLMNNITYASVIHRRSTKDYDISLTIKII